MMSVPQPVPADPSAAPGYGMAGRLRMTGRLALLLPHLLYGLALATVVRLDGTGRIPAERLASHWSRVLLRILGLRLRVTGDLARVRGLIVANHVSWLDIPLLSSRLPLRFVSKSEVRDWPVAGWLADAAGTFYLRRGKGGSRPLIQRLVPHLQQGGTVVVFPEGTTTAGQRVLGFHPRLFAAAVESGQPVHAVALSYGPTPEGHDLAPFVGDDDLASHLLRLLQAPGLSAELRFCGGFESAGNTRETLAETTRQAIEQALPHRRAG